MAPAERSLDESALLRAAAAKTPGEGFGGDEFREPLRVLFAALRDEAGLDPGGESRAVFSAFASLERRRRLSRMLRARPDIREHPIPAPIVILGLPRTGTTLLHDLLAADARHRAIRLWEMREPFAPDGAPEGWQAAAIAAAERMVAALHASAPRLAAIHPLRATGPDECSWLLRNGFATPALAFAWHVPSYLRWLLARDVRPDYACFRLQLQAILSQRPGAPLVLKDPCHLWHLDALLETFPDARVVQLHRCVEEVVASFCSLCQALQEDGARVRPAAEIGRYASDALEQGVTRSLAVRARLPAGRIIDVGYRDLVADPLEVAAALYPRLGLSLEGGARAGMRAALDGGRGRSGRHEYSLAAFGLDAQDIRRRFAPYTERFARHLAPPDLRE